MAVVGGLILVSLVFLRTTGRIRPFKVPTGGMKPALEPGDQFFMDGLSYTFHQPRRHDILVFTTQGIAEIEARGAGPAPIFIQRVAGLPGDRLMIRNGELYVNGEKDPFYEGHTFSIVSRMRYLEGFNPEVVVPENSYFVIGDNLPNSFDSRYWGFLPAKNVLGRAWLLYWPPQRVGFP